MRLKKLTILGFKSFADKVSLDFNCEVIGVVGPNGCGKSNIVDAFRWVLGEQSAKSLRGDKMHDVLFAGTDSRKPLGMAEVSVTLTDINGELPIAYDEVTITRRLYRNGDSEYLINRQPVRLKDVQNLFLGSGIGKNTFSVFEQGKLDQVIHLNPLERRGIFDEAAGIGRFLQRKKETVRKLNQVSENYNRVSDIHQEVEKHTKQLKKQAAQAKSFHENKERLEALERELLLTRWRTLYEKHYGLEEALFKLGEEIKEEHHRLLAVQQNVEKTKQELKEKEEKAKAEQIRLHKAETEAHLQEANLRQEKQRLVELEKKQCMLDGEKEAAEEKRAALVKQIDVKKEELQESAKKKSGFEKDLEKERGVYEQCEKQAGALKKELKAAREAHLSAVHEESRLQRDLQEKKLGLQADQQRLESLKERIKEKSDEQDVLKKEIAAKQKEVKSLSDIIDGLKSECDACSADVQNLKKEVREKQDEFQSCQKAMTELKAREKALLRLKEACEGFSSGAKILLKEPKFKGKVSGLFEALKPKDELIPAFQKYAQTLAVASKKDLEQVLAFAKKHQLSDFSVVHVDEETFFHLKDEKITKEGFYIDQKGVVFHFNAEHKEGNPFLREAELTALSKDLFEKNQEYEKLQKNLEKLLEKQKIAEEKGKAVDEKRRKREMGHVQENFALQRLRADLEKCGKELSAFEAERKKLKDAKEEKEALDALSKDLSSCQTKCAELLKAFKKHEEAVDAKEEILQKALRQWQEAQGVYQNALSCWQRCEQETTLLSAHAAQSSKLIEKLARELEEVKESIAAADASLKKRSKESEAGSSRLLDLEKSALKEDEELNTSRSKREELENILAEKRTALEALEKKRHHLEVVFAEDSAQRKAVEKELFDRHHLSPESLNSCEIVLEIDPEEAEQQIRQLRVTIDRAGSVNMTAIEEYQEQAQRFQELDRQLVDLEEAKKDLEKIIGKLDGECRKIFKETFEQIRENFRKNFAILFNGGEADLAFTESADILEAGIEITAKPPGKQMRSISLLSGGEKCLTALALLFSIFEVRPAPFCILDEVDAPLDDSNIDRFTAILSQYIDKTQFIIVTHNKKTMAIADLLLGVSMEEKGISKLISLAFEKAALAQNS